MTEPRHDQPIDPQLARLARLARLYREHALDEPSATVDQHILAAARQAVARPQTIRRNGWWQRWRMPLTLLTTIMLTASLALLVERQPEELASVPLREKSRGPARAESAPESAVPATAEPARQSPAPATPPTQDKSAKMRLNSKEIGLAQSSAGIADQAATSQPPSPPPPAAKTEQTPAPASIASEVAAHSEMRAAPARSSAPPAAAPLAKSRADSVRAPALWLDEIRALRNAGQSEEAAQQLREFRINHPDYPLPEEFQR